MIKEFKKVIDPKQFFQISNLLHILIYFLKQNRNIFNLIG